MVTVMLELRVSIMSVSRVVIHRMTPVVKDVIAMLRRRSVVTHATPIQIVMRAKRVTRPVNGASSVFAAMMSRSANSAVSPTVASLKRVDLT
jgi:hypothetical protein